MLFCSLEFFAFFAGVFALYWVIPWARPRVWLLLAASLYFYASWNRWLALVVLASSTFDYFVALAIDASRSPVAVSGAMSAPFPDRWMMMGVNRCSNPSSDMPSFNALILSG